LAIANWGTKWNAYSSPDDRDNENNIYFQTAWSNVYNLIYILSTMFPDVSFKYTYADEDCGCNVGYYEIRNGVIKSKVEHENNSLEAWDVYFDLHPEARNDFELVNGKWEYKDN